MKEDESKRKRLVDRVAKEIDSGVRKATLEANCWSRIANGSPASKGSQKLEE